MESYDRYHHRAVVKHAAKVAKWAADWRRSKRFGDNFIENIYMFLRDVKRARMFEQARKEIVKDANSLLLRACDEDVLNVEDVREANINVGNGGYSPCI